MLKSLKLQHQLRMLCMGEQKQRKSPTLTLWWGKYDVQRRLGIKVDGFVIGGKCLMLVKSVSGFKKLQMPTLASSLTCWYEQRRLNQASLSEKGGIAVNFSQALASAAWTCIGARQLADGPGTLTAGSVAVFDSWEWGKEVQPGANFAGQVCGPGHGRSQLG